MRNPKHKTINIKWKNTQKQNTLGGAAARILWINLKEKFFQNKIFFKKSQNTG